jgi:hypothetical protein
MKPSQSKAWEAALARHANSAAAFGLTVASLDEDSWTIPLGEGKWSPAQVTEHLNRTYRVVVDQLNGGKGIRIRSPWFLRQVLRQTMLRSIYRKRQLPKGARAPSEIVPKEVEGTQTELVERFRNLAKEFELAVDKNRGGRLTHHIFGEIEVERGIDFIAIHIEHLIDRFPRAQNDKGIIQKRRSLCRRQNESAG